MSRDVGVGFLAAAVFAACTWLVPFAGVPILALIAMPLAFALLAAYGFVPVLLIDGERDLRHTIGGALLLLAGGQLTAALCGWTFACAHDAALQWTRTGGAGALAPLVPPAVGALVPWLVLTAGLLLARRIRVAPAILVALLLVALAAAIANTLFLYAAFGLPLSA